MQSWISTAKLKHLFPLLFIGTILQAQDNSPYTRYALGNVKQNFNMANRLMGGVSVADTNALIANPLNPASYSGLRLTSYNVGFDATRNNIKTTSGSNQTGYATISYAVVGIAAGKGIGLAFGLLPQYNARFNMQKTDTLFGLYERTNNFYGGGSIQRLFAGGSYKYQHLSIGLNLGYTFGNIVNSVEAEFIDSQKILYNHNYSRLTVHGLYTQLGAIYQLQVNKDYSVNIGGSYTLSQKLKGNKEQHYETYIGDIESPLYNFKADSLYNVKGTISIPSELSIGTLLQRGDYWQLGVELNSSNWSKYTSYGMPDSTGSSWYVRLGGCITPDVNANKNYWKRVTYRAGAYTGQDIYKFNNTPLRKAAVTAGLSMPIRRTNMSIGQVNAGFEVGFRGTTKEALLKENFTRFVVGITLNDKWFIKRRYD